MKEVTKLDNIRIIKINSCKSLSGKSSLEYQLGCLGDSDIYIRVVKNSGGGWFSKEWIALQKIIAALESSKYPLTSYTLQTFFAGKSVNTAAFIFSALKEEGLVVVSKILLLVLQALERSLDIYLGSLNNTYDNYRPISNIVEEERLPYGQEYVSLLARKGKIDAFKEGRNWLTTKEAVLDYIEKRERKRKLN